jgi:hypothetical protein
MPFVSSHAGGDDSPVYLADQKPLRVDPQLALNVPHGIVLGHYQPAIHPKPDDLRLIFSLERADIHLPADNESPRNQYPAHRKDRDYAGRRT